MGQAAIMASPAGVPAKWRIELSLYTEQSCGEPAFAGLRGRRCLARGFLQKLETDSQLSCVYDWQEGFS